jgi:hypothetical protein
MLTLKEFPVLFANNLASYRYPGTRTLDDISSFSVKTLWQDSFHFLLQNEGILVSCGLKQAESGPKTTHVSDLRLSLGKNAHFQKWHFQVVFQLKTILLKITATGFGSVFTMRIRIQPTIM